MKKKTVFILTLLALTFILPTGINSQEEELVKNCLINIRSPFITGDRSMKAFLTGDEVAEFRTTFYHGNTYRIVLCSFDPGLIEFTLLDTNRNKLFNSKDYNNPALWDFKMEGSMECIIEARLNTDVAQSGMALLLIGFTNSDRRP